MSRSCPKCKTYLDYDDHWDDYHCGKCFERFDESDLDLSSITPPAPPANADHLGHPRRSGHEEAQELAEWEAAHNEVLQIIEAAEIHADDQSNRVLSSFAEHQLDAAMSVLIYLKNRKPQADPASEPAPESGADEMSGAKNQRSGGQNV